MTEARIGRIVVASLHQALADLLPTRLEFYEHWLSPAELRAGTMGLAPFMAVVSFLRQEPAYPEITERAGRYAAEWTVMGLSRGVRAGLRALPCALRARAVLWLARRLVRRTCRRTTATVTWSRLRATFELTGSLFCDVRQVGPQPRCGFYAAAVAQLLTLFGLDAAAEVLECRAAGDGRCLLAVVVHRPRRARL